MGCRRVNKRSAVHQPAPARGSVDLAALVHIWSAPRCKRETAVFGRRRRCSHLSGIVGGGVTDPRALMESARLPVLITLTVSARPAGGQARFSGRQAVPFMPSQCCSLFATRGTRYSELATRLWRPMGRGSSRVRSRLAGLRRRPESACRLPGRRACRSSSPPRRPVRSCWPAPRRRRWCDGGSSAPSPSGWCDPPCARPHAAPRVPRGSAAGANRRRRAC